MYSDGLYLLSNQDGTVIQMETAAADYNEYLMPLAFTVIEFGFVITEDVVALSTNFVIKLQARQLVAGASTTLATIEIGTDQTGLRSGDGAKAAVTAMADSTDLDVGDVVLANIGLPKSSISAEYLAIEVTQASNTAGGAGHPYAVLRLDGGADRRQTNVWSRVVTRLYALCAIEEGGL